MDGIALDPWGSDYASQVSVPHEADGAETTVQALEEPVEAGRWEAQRPQPAGQPAMTAVVDGVMRTDARSVVSQGERQFPGLFCSLAGGAVVVDRHVTLADLAVKRCSFNRCPTGLSIPFSPLARTHSGGAGLGLDLAA